MPNPIVHWEIAVTDYPKAKQFYSQLFDWTIDDNNPMNYGMVKSGGVDGGLFSTAGKMPNYVTIYVQVDDLQKSLDKAVQLGGKAIVPPTPIPGVGAIAMFTDPSGNMVAIFKR